MLPGLVLAALAGAPLVLGGAGGLVVAVLVGPAASARYFARTLTPMMSLAVAIAVASGIGGLYLSYYVRVAAGATVALIIVGAYLVCAAVSRVVAYHRTA